jgi:hypothetical protein
MTFYTAQKALNICHVSTLRNLKNSMYIIKIKTDHLILNKRNITKNMKKTFIIKLV